MPDIVSLVKTLGYLGLLGVIFAESGLFFGFFLPGDTLIFTAGFLAAQGFLNLPLLIAVIFIGAVTGYFVGYAFGQKVGPKIFTKEDSLFFNKKYLEKTRLFFARYGQRTVLFARFIPIVRTFAPILAGVGQMNWPRFVIYNIIGGLVWSTVLTFLGYLFGRGFSHLDQKTASLIFAAMIVIILIVSWLPILIRWLKDRKNSHAPYENFKSSAAGGTKDFSTDKH